eukprot:2661963-Prorocentrum_lima.AAC.1
MHLPLPFAQRHAFSPCSKPQDSVFTLPTAPAALSIPVCGFVSKSANPTLRAAASNPLPPFAVSIITPLQ